MFFLNKKKGRYQHRLVEKLKMDTLIVFSLRISYIFDVSYYTMIRDLSCFYKIDALDQLKRKIEYRAKQIKSYHVVPGDSLLILLKAQETNIICSASWGLTKSGKHNVAPHLFNAREETVVSQNSFRIAFRKQRCIILIDSFYTWKKRGNSPVAYRVFHKNDKILCCAGVYHVSEDKKLSCSLITTSA